MLIVYNIEISILGNAIIGLCQENLPKMRDKAADGYMILKRPSGGGVRLEREVGRVRDS